MIVYDDCTCATIKLNNIVKKKNKSACEALLVNVSCGIDQPVIFVCDLIEFCVLMDVWISWNEFLLTGTG